MPKCAIKVSLFVWVVGSTRKMHTQFLYCVSLVWFGSVVRMRKLAIKRLRGNIHIYMLVFIMLDLRQLGQKNI